MNISSSNNHPTTNNSIWWFIVFIILIMAIKIFGSDPTNNTCQEHTQITFDYQIWAYPKNGEIRFELMPLYNSSCKNLPEMQFHLHNADESEFGVILYAARVLTETTVPVPDEVDLTLEAVFISVGSHYETCLLNESRQEDVIFTVDGVYTKFYGTCTLTKLITE